MEGTMGWTEDRVCQLKQLWLDGLSASQIAKHLGNVTRNAVIGKVHRLGLSGRATPSQPMRSVFKTPRPSKAAQANAASKPGAEKLEAAAPLPMITNVMKLVVEDQGSATVLTLGSHMCKWPIGDPAKDNFGFCGRRTGESGPYCLEHAKMAYQPQQRKTKVSEGGDLTRSLRRYL